jgi:hypothetical protein
MGREISLILKKIFTPHLGEELSTERSNNATMGIMYSKNCPRSVLKESLSIVNASHYSHHGVTLSSERIDQITEDCFTSLSKSGIFTKVENFLI